MPHLLPTVLSGVDLPDAELHALRLDSEVFAVGDGFAAVDEIDEARLRAASLAAVLPERLIAERGTAAWVHGARDLPPPVHELCADAAARYRCLGRPRLLVREVILDEGDTTVIGGLRVTTAMRTILDVARFAEVFDEADGAVVRRLAEIGRLDRTACEAELDRRRHLPSKVRALQRIRSAFG